MSERIYLHLLILCGILCQGIIATSDEDKRESSDFLVRKRRVINHLLCGSNPIHSSRLKYIVNIKYDDRANCVGAILSQYSVITAASCFNESANLRSYKILSGGAYDRRSTAHEVTSKAVYYGNSPHQAIDGIALVTVNPLFVYGRVTGNIPLHVGTLLAGTVVTVSGWGSGYPTRPAPPGTRRRLRSINLPIMNHRECQIEYRYDQYNITEKHMCTYHEQQYCARTDIGAPLVFNDTLAGIHVLKGDMIRGKNPDVFVDLTRPEYSAWVREHTRLM